MQRCPASPGSVFNLYTPEWSRINQQLRNSSTPRSIHAALPGDGLRGVTHLGDIDLAELQVLGGIKPGEFPDRIVTAQRGDRWGWMGPLAGCFLDTLPEPVTHKKLIQPMEKSSDSRVQSGLLLNPLDEGVAMAG